MDLRGGDSVWPGTPLGQRALRVLRRRSACDEVGWRC